MNRFIKTIICLNFLFTDTFCMYNKLDEYYRIFKSVSVFHVSILYNAFKYGSSFTFNQVANDEFEASKPNEVQIQSDKDGNIIRLNDGKNVPLIIGNIPRKKDHLDRLKKILAGTNKKIGIYSFNLKYERDWSGLSELLNSNSDIEFYKYPTVDFSAPSFVDLLRFLRDLNNRHLKDESLTFVHCKAGRGRSALGIVAHLICELHKKGISKNYEQVEHYLRLKRPQISLNADHRNALKNFQDKLKDAGGLEGLLIRHKDEIELRDKQLLSRDF